MRSKQKPALPKNFILSLSQEQWQPIKVFHGEKGMCAQICILKESLWLQLGEHLGGARCAWRPLEGPDRDLQQPDGTRVSAAWTGDGEGGGLDGV